MRQEKMLIRNKGSLFVLSNTKNLLLFLVAGFLSAQQTPQEIISKMGRGINLGNVLSAPVEGNWSGAATAQYFQEIAQAGFTNVRIPIDFFGNRTTYTGSATTFSPNENTTFTGSRSDFVVSANYLDRLETVIGWGLANNLVVILDFHGSTLKSEFIYTFDQSQTAYYTHPTSEKRAADLAKFYSIWEQIADRFKMYNDDLIFEVINEPYFHISETDMNTINNEVISIVRNSGGNNITRKIIITGGTKTSYEAITTIDSQILNNDDFLIATFHYYRPFQFTKSSDYRYDTNSWGTTSDKINIDTEFDIVKNWANGFTPPVAVFLGEFGADNYYGYDYSEGDLKQVSANNAPNGTGYSDGGPDPNSRVDFHGYLANAAIDRGFAFSAWDAGGKGSKTIHLRKDSGLTVYDMDFFSIESFTPKTTTRSTVVESSIWVGDVKDALLNPYVARSCNDTYVLKNIDFECGYSNNWSLIPENNVSKATFEDASFASMGGSHGAKIKVLQSGALNSVLLSNVMVQNNNGSLNNKRYTFSVYGKGNFPDLTFKMRVKYTLNGNQFTGSQEKTLQTSYPQTPFTFSFDVPDGTTALQFQLLCGEDIGTYYFDNFSVTEETLSLKKRFRNINIYPNPVSTKIYIEKNVSILSASLYNINGEKIKSWETQKDQYDLSFLKNGIYFIKIIDENNFFCTKSIIKK